MIATVQTSCDAFKHVFTTMESTSGLTNCFALLLAGCLPDDNDRVLGVATALLVLVVAAREQLVRCHEQGTRKRYCSYIMKIAAESCVNVMN